MTDDEIRAELRCSGYGKADAERVVTHLRRALSGQFDPEDIVQHRVVGLARVGARLADEIRSVGTSSVLCVDEAGFARTHEGQVVGQVKAPQ